MPPTDRTPKRSYAVGRGKPPVEYQYKKGESGNLRGRPKSSSDFSDVLERQFDKHVTVEYGGRRRSVTLRVQSIRSLMQQALKGDVPAIRTYLKLQKKYEPRRKRKRELIIKMIEENSADDLPAANKRKK